MKILKKTWKAATSLEIVGFLNIIPTLTAGWLISDMIIAGSLLYPHAIVAGVLLVSWYSTIRVLAEYQRERRLRKSHEETLGHVESRLDKLIEEMENDDA